ncbi:MAG: serine/threonine-protein kinase [Planctomycetota bacterium]
MPSWAPGKVVGEYRLLEQLGAGGMGAVWRAEHLPTGALRALKTTVADPEALVRFEREAQALARLNHPHVARVHTAQVCEGVPYLVLDLAQGGDLATRLKLGPLPPEEARALARDLALGLAHVHAAGLLHRDLKPQNVVFDDQGRPLLVDFGLTRQVGGSSLTRSGAILGTPAYMAPEQVDDARAVDERADVYGLGAVLYHALTGEPPFRGATALAVLQDVLERDPLPPRKLAPQVPPRLDALCLQALAKDPAERPASARAFANALAACDLNATRGADRRAVWVAGLLLGLTLLALSGALLRRGVAEQEQAQAPPTAPEAAPVPAPELAQRAKDVHPLDAALSELPRPTEADLAGYPFEAVLGGTAEVLLDASMPNSLTDAAEWLTQRTGDPRAGWALLYWVARAGQAVPDPEARAVSQVGWMKLGKVLRQDPTPLWSDQAWKEVGGEVVLECFRRAAAAGRSDGWVNVGNMYHWGEEGLRIDRARAQEAYAETRRARFLDPTDDLVARLRLAEIALVAPDLPGRVPDAQALRFARDAFDGLRDLWQQRDAAKIARGLAERLRAAGGDPGALPHLLDAYGQRLPRPAWGDLVDCPRPEVQYEGQRMLQGISATPLSAACTWLDEERGRLDLALGLSYEVARNSEDENGREGWWKLGMLLRDPAAREAFDVSATDYANDYPELVLEAYRRAADAGRSDGLLTLAGIYAGGGERALGVTPDLPRALALFLEAQRAPVVAQDEDRLAAWLGLAELCLAHPELADRPSDRELLAQLPEVADLERARGARVERAREVRAELEARVGGR